MKQLRVHGPGDVRLDDVPVPRPGPRDALVRVSACGVCGTDVTYARNGGLTEGPMALGHEMAGVVEWAGAEVVGTSVGDRVVVHPADGTSPRLGNGAGEGGLTPLLLVRQAAKGGRLLPVPEGMSLEVAALAEPLAVGMQAVNQAEAAPGDRVAVFGCGPIGLLAIATLADRGVEDVVAFDPSPGRRDLAERLGAVQALDPGSVDPWEELAARHGTAPFLFGPTPATDAYIEASGAEGVIGDILGHGRPGARLSIVALHFRPEPTDFLQVLMRQFTIRGSFEYPPRFEDALDLLARRDLSGLITHTLPLESFDRAFEVLATSRDCGKVLLTMGAG